MKAHRAIVINLGCGRCVCWRVEIEPGQHAPAINHTTPHRTAFVSGVGVPERFKMPVVVSELDAVRFKPFREQRPVTWRQVKVHDQIRLFRMRLAFHSLGCPMVLDINWPVRHRTPKLMRHESTRTSRSTSLNRRPNASGSRRAPAMNCTPSRNAAAVNAARRSPDSSSRPGIWTRSAP